jgi:uridine kinase
MNQIRTSQKGATVQIFLPGPDGKTLEGPRGTTVGEFLSFIEYEAELVAAVVNNDLRELTYPIEIESVVRPVLIDSPDGARIYRRSLTFLLEMAFEDLFPEAKLFVDHSVASGGYYCQVAGREPLADTEVAALNSHMQKLIEDDLPFERHEVPLEEAVAYFKSRGYEDKESLLKYRTKDYLT